MWCINRNTLSCFCFNIIMSSDWKQAHVHSESIHTQFQSNDRPLMYFLHTAAERKLWKRLQKAFKLQFICFHNVEERKTKLQWHAMSCPWTKWFICTLPVYINMKKEFSFWGQVLAYQMRLGFGSVPPFPRLNQWSGAFPRTLSVLVSPS